MNDPFYHKLLEISWRRKLTKSEVAELRAWLADHPEARSNWEGEAGLNALLGELPEAPVASNFTARVLQAAERPSPHSKWIWYPAALRPFPRRLLFWRRHLPKAAAFATVVLCASLGWLTYHKAATTKQVKLAQKARSVATISEFSSMADPEILQNFEAIRQLDSKPAADKSLFAVLSYLQ